MTKKPPGDLFVPDMGGKVRDWPTMTTKVSPQMKAHMLEALHQEGWTLSVSEYIRVVLARHVAEVLGLTPVEVLANQPLHGSRAGVRYVRVERKDA